MRTVVGVMGSGEPLDPVGYTRAYEVGRLVADRGWVLVNGGRAAGVMDASAKGAHDSGGLVVGVLPDADADEASKHLDIAVRTGMGEARNVVNVLTSDVVIALPGGAGTLSEIALALRADVPVVALDFPLGVAFARFESTGLLSYADTPEEAVGLAARELARRGR